jgi:hypothetical protein
MQGLGFILMELTIIILTSQWKNSSTQSLLDWSAYL